MDWLKFCLPAAFPQDFMMQTLCRKVHVGSSIAKLHLYAFVALLLVNIAMATSSNMSLNMSTGSSLADQSITPFPTYETQMSTIPSTAYMYIPTTFPFTISSRAASTPNTHMSTFLNSSLSQSQVSSSADMALSSTNMMLTPSPIISQSDTLSLFVTPSLSLSSAPSSSSSSLSSSLSSSSQSFPSSFAYLPSSSPALPILSSSSSSISISSSSSSISSPSSLPLSPSLPSSSSSSSSPSPSPSPSSSPTRILSSFPSSSELLLMTSLVATSQISSSPMMSASSLLPSPTSPSPSIPSQSSNSPSNVTSSSILPTLSLAPTPMQPTPSPSMALSTEPMLTTAGPVELSILQWFGIAVGGAAVLFALFLIYHCVQVRQREVYRQKKVLKKEILDFSQSNRQDRVTSWRNSLALDAMAMHIELPHEDSVDMQAMDNLGFDDVFLDNDEKSAGTNSVPPQTNL